MNNTSVNKNKTFNVRGLIIGLAVAVILMRIESTVGLHPIVIPRRIA
jgi:hypothetical protein